MIRKYKFYNREGLCFNSTPGIPTADYINHTPAVVTVDGRSYTIAAPNKVVRINNAKDSPQKIVGSSIGLPVYPGDKISAEVFSKYINFEKDNINLLPGLAALLSSSFGLPAPVDGMATIFDSYVNELGTLAALGEINEDVPRAFLNYILFDKNFIMTGYGVVQVSEVAAIPGEDPFRHPHERLSFDGPITVQEEGFIYIFVSNDDGQDMDVYFDDFRVTHEYGDIVAGGDHYPFGLAMNGRQVTREPYRYGYQGQFSEKDGETGWNSFEARQWDARVGRWLSVDPSRQFYSSYLGMGNNPVNGVDPDGRYSRFGAWWRSGFSSDIYEVNGEWGYNTVTGNGDGINVTFNYGGNRTLSFKTDFKSLVSGKKLPGRTL